MRWSASQVLCVALVVLIASSDGAGQERKSKKQQKQARSWGEVVDPDGDCNFTFGKKKLVISIPGSVHGMSIERGETNAPRVWDDVTGDFVATVKVSGEFPKGAESLVASRKPFHGAGLVALQDDNTYVRLERAEMVLGGRNVSYTSFELRQNGRWVKAGNSGEYPLKPDQPTWLRLERRGEFIHASVSQDGEKWIELDSLRSPLGKYLKVGVMAGHNTTSPFAPKFEEYELTAME